MPPDTGSKLAWETSGRPTGEQIRITRYSHSQPWINQHSSLERLIPQKKPKKLNNKQRTEKKHAAEGAGCCKHTGDGGQGQGADLHGNFQ
jgi:hypothetical protein